MTSQPLKDDELSNVTFAMRNILANYEKFVSVNLFEGQSYSYNNSAFSMKVSKFSRMAGSL